MATIPSEIRCKCGRQSVEFDSWFLWFPCELHKHLTPVEYSKWEPKDSEKFNPRRPPKFL